jgi:hypothetical protein
MTDVPHFSQLLDPAVAQLGQEQVKKNQAKNALLRKIVMLCIVEP